MAAHNRFKLRPVKVTQRSTYGSRKVSTLKRSHPSGHLNEQPENEQSQSPSTAFETSVVLNDEEEEGLTEHRLGCISSISRWSEMREDLRKTVTENAALPINQLCLFCHKEKACLRFQKCGPLSFFCNSCYERWHASTNFFHVPERWEVRIYLVTDYGACPIYFWKN